MTGSNMDSETIKKKPLIADDDPRPFEELAAVMWREPMGWQRPEWLDPEPCPASLPMKVERFFWCRHAIGWWRSELGRRCRANATTMRRLEKSNRLIPDTLAIWLEAQVTRALTPIGSLHVFWHTPPDWERPGWLKPEWCPAGIPMVIARMMWCLHVTGWTLFEASRRGGPSERAIHDMIEGRLAIPASFAIFLEVHTTRVLSGEPEAPTWRSYLNTRPDVEDEGEDAAGVHQ